MQADIIINLIIEFSFYLTSVFNIKITYNAICYYSSNTAIKQDRDVSLPTQT